VAILSGDAMLIQAYQLIIKTKPQCIQAVMETFNTTALEVCQGQQMDMDFQFRSDVIMDEYIEMIRLKTSVLLGGSMKIGAIVAGAEEEDQQAIYNFAIYLGLSFQLWDDYLDTFGDSEKTGKQVGGDILANKKTFLMLEALRVANPEQKALLEAQFTAATQSAEKIKTVVALFQTLKIDEALKNKVEHYFHLALQSLDKISVGVERKEKIKTLALSLHHRDH
jgi:geranylgeranyl diphosphate synthase type II